MTRYENDMELMQAFHARMPDADSSVFHLHFRSMCLLAETLTQDRAAAEDIVADCFIRLFEKRAEFEALENIRAFLYVSVRNASLTHNTTRKRHQAAHEQLAAGQRPLYEVPVSAVELEMLRAELLEGIFQEMENLPTQCRTICKLVFLEGKRTEEIAKILGLNPQTVRSQKSRGIQLLKAQLFKKQQFTLLAFLMLWSGQWSGNQ